MTALEKKIYEIVDENSGGVKFLQLVGLLAEKFDESPEEIMLTASKMPDLGCLEYHMILDAELHRSKFFIYRKSYQVYSISANEMDKLKSLIKSIRDISILQSVCSNDFDEIESFIEGLSK